MPTQNEGSNIDSTQQDIASVPTSPQPLEATRLPDATAPAAATQPTEPNVILPQSSPANATPPASSDATRLPNTSSQAGSVDPNVQKWRMNTGVYSRRRSSSLPAIRQTMRENPWLWILLIVLLLALVVAIIVFSHNRSDDSHTNTNGATTSVNRSFIVGPDPVIVIDGHNTNVDVRTGDANTVAVMPHNHNSNTVPNNTDTSIVYNQSVDNQGHNHIGINTQSGFRDVDYTLTVPASAHIQITVNSGSISVNGTSGASIDTGSGSLDVENVQGPINVHTDSGDITVRNVKGSMKVEGSSGSLHLTNVNGQLSATTRSGDVIVRQSILSGQSVLRTNSGSVRYEGALDPNGAYQLQSESGDVDLALPANTAFQLAASTGSGSVHNDFASDSVGNPPLAQITATTGSGSVTVNKD